ARAVGLVGARADRKLYSQRWSDMVGSPFPGWSAIAWRHIVAGAQTERRGGAEPAGDKLCGKDPAGRFPLMLQDGSCKPSYTDGLILLLLDAEQLRRFCAARGLILFHPCHGPVVPFAGFGLVAELPVGQGQEEPAEAVAPLLEG